MIEKILSGIGLSEKEIKVYLCSVRMGTQPASSIARRVQLPRNTARFMLDRLVEKGFVRKATRANMQLYSPESPESLIDTFKYQKAEVNEAYGKKIELVKKTLEELQARYRPKSSKPKVSYYEGKAGLMKVYDDTLTSSETIRSFACYDMIREEFTDYFKSYFERRMQNKIPVQCIHPDTPLGILEAKKDNAEMRESRLLPHKTYYFTPEIQIYDNKLSITSWKETLGIMIESPEIYEAFKVIFDLAWKEAGRIDPRAKKDSIPTQTKKRK